MVLDELTYIFISAVINAICTGFALYIGFRKGVEKTVDLIIDKLQRRYEGDCNARELVSSVSSFFRNMNDFIESGEVKTLINDTSMLIRSLITPPPKRKVKKLDS